VVGDSVTETDLRWQAATPGQASYDSYMSEWPQMPPGAEGPRVPMTAVPEVCVWSSPQQILGMQALHYCNPKKENPAAGLCPVRLSTPAPQLIPEAGALAFGEMWELD
jgi:hypothetical protein